MSKPTLEEALDLIRALLPLISQTIHQDPEAAGYPVVQAARSLVVTEDAANGDMLGEWHGRNA